MNLVSQWSTPTKLLFRFAMYYRRLLPKKRSNAFGIPNSTEQSRIEHIYVINLNRQPARWAEMKQELSHVRDFCGNKLLHLAERYAAVDARHFLQDPIKDAEVDPIYTLGDQLFVEPQPLVLPTKVELNSPIQMSRPEVAIARSHINIWKKVALSDYKYVLVLEDDVWFSPKFAIHLNQVWDEIETKENRRSNFDILYLSYKEVKNGAPKTFFSNNIFQPDRGLWHLSGYVISREGAKKLLRLLPCQGPVDLWINHQFKFLDVLATRKSIIRQRPDLSSTNSYSILPTLTKIGTITSETASLFQISPDEKPVFVFGPADSGLSSLAMALSMLGYRCCSDLKELPRSELKKLLTGDNDRIFDAYVNIGSLAGNIRILKELYPNAKFIITSNHSGINDDSEIRFLKDLKETDLIILHLGGANKWQAICEHLRCAPPACSFPELPDLGQRKLLCKKVEADAVPIVETSKRDESPWVVERRNWWHGIHLVSTERNSALPVTPVKINDCLEFLEKRNWFARKDTFSDNLALFQPSNIKFCPARGASLIIRKESLGVRKYSAAALTSCHQYLYGRFEAVIRASNVPGVVTGFFLHRDSPRQEIDIEIAGNRPDRLLVNVFYNPGDEGAKFDYGYRGTPTYIDLGFDASEADHLFTIEWGPREMRWLVDNRLVHRRVQWQPTPIPHLPMALHVNSWISRSKELAGRLAHQQLPTSTFIKSISLEANRHQISQQYEYSIL